MKKIFLIVVLCFGVFSLTQAQPNTNQGAVKTASSKSSDPELVNAEHQAQQLKKTLTLSDSQTAQVKVIYKNYMDKRKELTSTAKKSGKKVDPKQMAELKTQQNNEIEALLSADQKAKFESSLNPKSGKTKPQTTSKKADTKGEK